ncbi:MAG TPA: hypothetical protein VGN14_17050 [Candidatus Elarobacter sp.]
MNLLRVAIAFAAAGASTACATTYALVPSPQPTLAIVGSGSPESSSAIQHTIGSDRWTTTTANGSGTVPVFDSAPLAGAHPALTRVVLIVHGETRDAGQYYDDVETGAKATGSTVTALVVAPQFLNTADVQDRKNALPATILGWHVDQYSDGDDAQTPAAISAFDVLDALVTSFTNRASYPALTTIVLAGHSGGAQLMQRYAVIGHAHAAARAAGYDVRFVIASPSSFLYFDEERPRLKGGFKPGGRNCPTFDDWRFGLKAPPRYVGTPSATTLWAAYTGLAVTYISGADDVDPHGSIDQSCMAEEQGATRVARASNYLAYLAHRYGKPWPQPLITVLGVGHSDQQMLTSQQAEKALFGP